MLVNTYLKIQQKRGGKKKKGKKKSWLYIKQQTSPVHLGHCVWGKYDTRISVKRIQAGMSQLRSPTDSQHFPQNKKNSHGYGIVCKSCTRECGYLQAQLLVKVIPEPRIHYRKMSQQKLHPATLSVGSQELCEWQVND